MSLPTQGRIIMTHDDIKVSLDDLDDYRDSLLAIQELVKMAYEIAESSDCKNFERIALLLELYNSRFECFIQQIEYLVIRLRKGLLLNE